MVNLKIVNKVPCFVNGVLILGIDNNPSLGLYGWALIIILSSSRQTNSVFWLIRVHQYGVRISSLLIAFW